MINNKPLINRESDNQEIVDLTVQNYHPTKNPIIVDFVRLNKDFIMRPDLIAKQLYGSTDYEKIYYFWKQNYYTNPFSIDEGDLFFVQELDEFSNQIDDVTQKSNIEQMRNQYIDPKKKTKKDDKIEKFEKHKKPKLKRATDEPALPPNLADVGDQELTVRGGKIVFGEDISKNKEVCREPISKTEFLNRLIKKRLNNNNNQDE